MVDRNTTTGALTQKTGTAGCISETGSATCVDGGGLSGAYTVTVSPDNTSVYVASGSSNAVTVFDRAYVAPPPITSASPTGGPAGGATALTITGTGVISGITVIRLSGETMSSAPSSPHPSGNHGSFINLVILCLPPNPGECG
ncbi:MAG: hypothetical protein EXQ74_01610 [Thermoleophilia bacterium]|nr:hypothetical protein [Thermoleophilia bacterium]